MKKALVTHSGDIRKMISIIVPIYNSEAYLEECLDSIQSQTYVDWECILVDDGSIDGSSNIADFYCIKDNRFRAIHQHNHGVSFARNIGLEASKGEYVVFVDSDDWIDRQYLEKLYEALSNNEVELSVCGLQQVYPDGRIEKYSTESCVFTIDQDHESDFVRLNEKYLLFGPVIKLYKSSIIKNNSNLRFEVGCSYGEDLVFNFKYLEKVKRIAVITDVLYNYRRANIESLSSKEDEMRFERDYEQWKIVSDFFRNRHLYSDLSRDYIYSRLWGIVYDGVFRYRRLNSKRIDYLKYVLSIPEIDCLNDYGSFPCSKWIRIMILYRYYRLFYLYFKLLG